LKSQEVDDLFTFATKTPGSEISADLNAQTFSANGKNYSFNIDAFSKECLLKGLDQIGWTLQFENKIQEYEKSMIAKKPWLWKRRKPKALSYIV